MSCKKVFTGFVPGKSQRVVESLVEALLSTYSNQNPEAKKYVIINISRTVALYGGETFQGMNK